MAKVKFNPKYEKIIVSLEIYGINGSSHTIRVVLDTGSAFSCIPPDIALDLGYDIENPKEVKSFISATSIGEAPLIEVERVTAIGQDMKNFDVLCHYLPEESTVDGILGLNFLSHFDLSISFSEGTIEIESHDGYKWQAF